MSKRHGATSVIDYKTMGYLPEAMRNYLLRLGWSHGNDEIISDEQAIDFFNLKNIGKSPSRFDFPKLNHLNKHYIKNKNSKYLLEILNNSYKINELNISNEKILKILDFSKEKVELLPDFIKILNIYQENFVDKINENDQNIINDKKAILINLKNHFINLELWNHDSIKDSINQFCQYYNLKIKDFGIALRISLTFSSASAGGLFDVIELLGKNEIIKRLNLVI
jgi:glutamyl-tRNA synthetase